MSSNETNKTGFSVLFKIFVIVKLTGHRQVVPDILKFIKKYFI